MKPYIPDEITKPQLNYIQILSDELEFDSFRRNRYISEHLKLSPDIKTLDELTKTQASKIISYFIELKQVKNNS